VPALFFQLTPTGRSWFRRRRRETGDRGMA
jgi:hypothetical protein